MKTELSAYIPSSTQGSGEGVELAEKWLSLELICWLCQLCDWTVIKYILLRRSRVGAAAVTTAVGSTSLSPDDELDEGLSTIQEGESGKSELEQMRGFGDTATVVGGRQYWGRPVNDS